jgi:ribosomal protein S18 acetylase RimI-like enzyme
MGPNGDGRRRPEGDPAGGHQAPHGPHGGDPPESRRAPRIRAGTRADTPAVAALHARQISEGFLSLLGDRFLKLLYRRILLHPACFLLVADDRGDAVGFIAGSTDVAGLYRSFLWRDGAAALVRAAGPLARGWRRVLETLRHGSPGGDGTHSGAELLSVAVGRSWQGRGAGRLLVASLLEEMEARGCGVVTVVVGADNDGAVALYHRSGFVAVERFELHPGTESLLMRWERAAPPAPSEAAPE